MESKHFKRFTQAEHTFIRDNILSMTNLQIGRALGRSESSISWQVSQLGLHRNIKRWTDDEVMQLRELVKSKTRKQLADIFNVTDSSIKAVLKTNGIKTGRSGMFKKGNISHNKGKKMPPGWATEGMKRTWFKKGAIPHNTKFDGAIAVRDIQGKPYKFIRVGVNKWELLNRFNYTKFIGPIPEDMLVTFKDRNQLNCEPSNLVLESKQEHMSRNTIMRFDADLRSVIRLLSNYKRKVKTYEKQD